MRTILRRSLVTVVSMCVMASASAWAQCSGDCDGDGSIRVGDLHRGLDAIIAGSRSSVCSAMDVDRDRHISLEELVGAVDRATGGCLRVAAPSLASSRPGAGATGVAVGSWIELDFDGAVDPRASQACTLHCDGAPHPLAVAAIGPRKWLVNPAAQLPANATCELRWQGPEAETSLSFETETARETPIVRYDRDDRRAAVPFPDDVWLVEDSSQPNGTRVNVPIPSGPGDVQAIFRALLRETNKLDGFSPLAPFVVELEEAVDPNSIPRSPAEALDPLASMGLFDITPGSPSFGKRIPFRVDARSDRNTRGLLTHSLVIFPSIPLEPGARYGLVLTRRALSVRGPYAPSPFLNRVLQPPSLGESAATAQARQVLEPVLDVLAANAEPPIPADDLALAVRLSVRSTDDIPSDLLAIKEQILQSPPPEFTITSVTADGSPHVAAIVRGEWMAPDWRDGQYFKRDAQGRPLRVKTNRLPFVLALPKGSEQTPAPLTLYQHGNPGSAEREVPSEARSYLGAAGFAVSGFTDVLNRELSAGVSSDEAIAAQVTAIFFSIIQNRRVPDAWVQLNAEQLAFLRMLSTFGRIDVLPIGAPDGKPEIDATLPLTYVGISQGANYAPALLPYAPEIRAAALVAGGARLAEVLLHQQPQAFLSQLGGIFPNLSAAEIWVGLSLFQHIYDRQDAHNHGRFVYREPLVVAGTSRKASLLQIEGLDDTLVPNHASESLAFQMGPIPHLLPAARPVPFLTTTVGPVRANIDPETTAAFFQYVPIGVAGIDPTPGCLAIGEGEGHYCSQSAAESRQQRSAFFRSAVFEAVPTILSP